MFSFKSFFTALVLAGSVASVASAQTPSQTAETKYSQYPETQVAHSVCVRNDLDRTVGLTATWAVGDGWASYLLAPGETMIFRLVTDATDAGLHQLNVRYREYFGGILIAQRALYTTVPYFPMPEGSCGWAPKYAFQGDFDGHLRTHVSLNALPVPVYYGQGEQGSQGGQN